MKRMLMVLMMVFGLSSVFADSYVAFTNNEEFEEYCNSNHSEWDAEQKALFEEATADLSAKQKKNTKLITVCGDNDGVIKNHILVFIRDSETYVVMVVDDNFDIIVYRIVYVYEKTDPVMIGLSFLNDKVTHIVDIDNQKVMFESYNPVKE